MKNKKGFTLIELIVVIVIIGILAAIAIPRLVGFTDSAEAKAVESSYRAVLSAAQMYRAAEGDWPDAGADLDDYLDDAWTGVVTSVTGNNGTISLDADGIEAAHPASGESWDYEF